MSTTIVTRYPLAPAGQLDIEPDGYSCEPAVTVSAGTVTGTIVRVAHRTESGRLVVEYTAEVAAGCLRSGCAGIADLESMSAGHWQDLAIVARALAQLLRQLQP